MAYPYAGKDIFYLRQHPREWIRWLKIALAAARRLKNRANEGVALGTLGLAYRNVGETQRAIQFHEQHLTIARELGDRRGEGTVLWNMSLSLDQLGQRAKAIQYAEQSLTILEQIENPNAARVRAQLAAWREETTSNQDLSEEDTFLPALAR